MVNGASCSISRLPPIVPAGFGRLLTMRRWPYRTSDGYLCVLIYDDVHWQRFFATIGGPDPMTRDPKFAHCVRSEEHTSELQSLMRISYAVFCLKKKNKHHNTKITN